MPLTRRNFMMYSSLLAGSTLIESTSVAQAGSNPTPINFALSNTLPIDGVFVLSALPYADNVLEPVITANTLSFHYGKHHQGYLNNLNALLALPENQRYVGKSLEQIIQISTKRKKDVAIFTNAAQAFNHTFYWESLRAYSGDTSDTPMPEGRLLAKLNAAFGDYETFKAALLAAAVGKLGSGWVWLVQDNSVLKIVTTSNADTAFISGVKPLLVIDVWEHAYYLDWQNRRKDHVSAVIAKLLNWEKITARFNQI